MRNFRLGVAAVALMAPVAVYAQDTTGSIRGSVIDASGNLVPGAQITVVHTPSGTRNTVTTDAAGAFNAAGLRLGGPFEVTVDAPGFAPVVTPVLNLTAGNPQIVELVVGDDAAAETITVTGTRVRSAATLGGGAATVLSERDIAGIASVNRDIRNLAARDPLVTLDPTNGFGAISIAGQNNRFNRFTVDGIAFGDPFGLEAGGLVSARGPVPLDAIGEFSVEVAPVDIRQGFFQGGAINAQLKSGNNDFTGLGAFYYSSDGLRGRRTRNLTREGAFESQVYTAQITGPIIRDRLFFAVTWERLRDQVPAEILPGQIGITQAQIDQITNISNSVYSYDPLGVATNVSEADDKVVAKLDFNIADGHRLSATYIYNEGNILAGQTGSGQLNATNPTFSLQSNNYSQGAINHFGVVQLNNQWTDAFSTQVRVSYSDYERLQTPFNGTEFGQFQVCLDPTSVTAPLTCSTGQTRLQFGPDISRQANELYSQTLSVEALASLQVGDSTFQLIAERRVQDISNLFAQRVSGAFYFDSIADLQNRRANELDFAVPLLGGLDTVTADFQNNSWTFGIQNTWNLTPTLTATYGLRYDMFDTSDRPIFNPNFLARYGFTNLETLQGRDLLQPRIGINWRPSQRLNARVAGGLYGGGNPNVWISNNYSNPGPTLARVQVRRAENGQFTISGVSGLSAAQVQAIGAATLNGVSGGPGIPQTLINALRGDGPANAPTNALDPNFRAPSQWRVSGSVDYRADFGPLGDGWNLGADVVWSRVRDALTWTDLRSVPIGTLPDGRPRYGPLNPQAGNNTDMILTNTDQGHSWNIVGRVNKRWDNGLFAGGSYTYQYVRDLNPGTSSVAQSNYNNAASIDPNNAAFGISNFERANQYRINLGLDTELFGDNNTRFELFFNSRSGLPFSYTFADQASGTARSTVFGTTGTNNRYLLYVPNVSSITADSRVIYQGFVAPVAAGQPARTPAQQAALQAAANAEFFQNFQALIQNGQLDEYQGQIADKNIGRSPRFNKLDLSIRQEVPLPLGAKFELFGDMENVLNFINRDWGSIRQVAFPGYGTLVNVQCANAAGQPITGNPTAAAPCAQYIYSPRARDTNAVTEPEQVIDLAPSLWSIRIGARISF